MNLNFIQPLANVFEFEVCAGDWARILSVVVLFSVDTFVVGEVNVVDIVMIFRSCHFLYIVCCV